MTKNWMRQLAQHYEATRQQHPDRDLLVLFDIDGTIVDVREMILSVLHAYDRAHGTRWFRALVADGISVQENALAQFLETLRLPPPAVQSVLDWYDSHRWSARALLEAHRPYHGVLEVIRWFQIQPRTFVGINSSRGERLRAETLRILNTLGREYRVQFSSSLLHMAQDSESRPVTAIKMDGVRHFQQNGYHVLAVVDDDGDNLRAISSLDPQGDILLLQAATIFAAKRARVPAGAARGDSYDLTELIAEHTLPQHIQFIWRGVNDDANLRQFLGSNIHWAEFDVQTDARSGHLVLREDSLLARPPDEHEDLLGLDHALALMRDHGAGVVLHLHSAACIEGALAAVDRFGFEDRHLWFRGDLEKLQEEGFREIVRQHPEAIVECPIDFLAPLIHAVPAQAKGILDMLRDWGINRYGIRWETPASRLVFDRMDEWGVRVNIDAVPDLEAFLQAALLLPRSITSDFNFPKWHYYGLGGGGQRQGRRYTEGERPLRRA